MVDTTVQLTGNSGFSTYGTDRPCLPVLVSVPHAGRDYPDAVFAALRLPPASLLRLEDRYADLLVRDAIANHVPTIIAHRARAWIDLNRDERDVDVEMVHGLDRTDYPTPGIKQRGGLGLIPRRLSGEGDIWKRSISAAEVDARVSGFHRPYHAAVAQTLQNMHAKYGVAILLDVHSMPPVQQSNGPAPSFVVGDHFGRSAAGNFSESLVANIVAHGFPVALNHPYSGDYILRRHGAVKRNIHALQLEVDRSLYLDPALREPAPGLAKVSRMIATLVNVLSEEASGLQTLIAAE